MTPRRFLGAASEPPHYLAQMLFRRDADERDPPKVKADRSWPTRVAWGVLVGGTAMVLLRASAATVIEIHGDGMAPTILDGDSVLLVRGELAIEAGDIVVYDPTPAIEPDDLGTPTLAPELGEDPSRSRHVDPSVEAGEQLRNTAVVDVDEVEGNWRRVQSSANPAATRSFRVGRVLASPGERVTFHTRDAALGLQVGERLLRQKPADPQRLRLTNRVGEGVAEASPSDAQARMYAVSYEWLGDSRYPVLTSEEPASWPGMSLPDDLGPVEIRAPGYLVLADNRDEGSCCDSRRLGWIPADHIRGEIVLRLEGNPHAAPDLDPGARRFQWLP